MFLGRALNLISLKIRYYFLEKNFLKKIFSTHRATGCQNLKISKACQKFGKFRQSWNNYKESNLGKKHFLWRSSRYAKSKIDKLAEKKTAKCPEHLAQSLNICNKIKLFQNTISFFPQKFPLYRANAGLTNLLHFSH